MSGGERDGLARKGWEEREGGTDRLPELVERLARMKTVDKVHVLRGLSARDRSTLAEMWRLWAHPGQMAPPGDWRVWLIRAGRGFGKTRAGAEWVNHVARETPGIRLALVGATIDDVRRVMIEGPSGIVTTAQTDDAVEWRRDRGELRWPNDTIAHVYSAEAGEALRGPEHHAAWCDELGKWRQGDRAWDNLMMGMRAGDAPQVLVTTTPRPTALMRRVMATPGLVETVGRTADNPHLPPRFVEAMAASYAGTRLGRQELDGEMIDDVAGALWTRAAIEACRVAALPAVARVVVAVDPPVGIGHDACGIVAAAKAHDGHAYVIEDASVVGATPERWARAVAACAARVGADRVVAEANQGGEMVRFTLDAAAVRLPVKLVHASKGKVARAEPVAALYESGRAWHVGAFPALEDELCGLTIGGGYEGPGRSPDRADALVWALTELMLEGRQGEPGLRVM